jgi:hypothetical protein
LYAIYLKAQNQMYSNFWQSWIHRQSAFTNNVPEKKKKPAIEGPPTLYSKMYLLDQTNANSSNVMSWGQP